jgi:hypothetical protein
MGGAERNYGPKGPGPRQSQQKNTGQTKNHSVLRSTSMIAYASGSNLLDLLTKAVNTIQRAWINKDSTL